MHISGYVCKICHKELGILLKCKETFQQFLAASTLLKILVFHIFFGSILANVFLKIYLSVQQVVLVTIANSFNFLVSCRYQDH